jgi:hypothetical protein
MAFSPFDYFPLASIAICTYIDVTSNELKVSEDDLKPMSNGTAKRK